MAYTPTTIPSWLVAVTAIVGLCLTCLCSDALKVEFVEASPVMSGRSLWRPTAASKLSDDAFCFGAVDTSCTSHACPETLLCSLDRGNTFIDAPVTLSFCGPRGVLVSGQLLCPAGALPRSQPNEVSFSVVSFQADADTVLETVTADKQLVFRHDAALTAIEFTGTTLYLASEDQYVMVATVVEEEEERRVPVLFISEDGLAWETKNKVPLDGEEYFLEANGAGALFVFARNEERYSVVSSKYLGKWWSTPQLLNTTTPPFMASLPASGVTVEYSTHNSSKNSELAYSTGRQKTPSRVHLTNSTETKDGCSTSSNYATGVVTARDGVNEMLMLHDCDQRLLLSKFTVDDSAEVTKKAQEESERKVKLAAAEDAKRKAKARKLEQQRAERRKRRQIEQERQQRFRELDAPNWEDASKHFQEDGEWVVVRRVRRDTVDLEKTTFFPDIHE